MLPGIADRTAPTFANRSFVAGAPAGMGNLNNLALNPIMPIAMPASRPGEGNWLIRANATASVPDHGTTALLLGLSCMALGASYRVLRAIPRG